MHSFLLEPVYHDKTSSSSFEGNGERRMRVEATDLERPAEIQVQERDELGVFAGG